MSDDQDETIAPLNPRRGDDAASAKASRTARSAFKKNSSAFVRAMQSAMREYLAMRGQGVERDDAIRGVELVLRETWPAKPTKFPPCDLCGDTGWSERVCQAYARCQRALCSERGDGWEHRYVIPCSCPRGDRFRPRPKGEPEAIAAAGKVKKLPGFSKVGR